jgi:hypothetical protein
MKRAIDDRAAIAFAVGFYRALALGKSVRTAFDLGRNEIALRGLPDSDVPELIHRADVEPSNVFLGRGSQARRVRAMLRSSWRDLERLLCSSSASTRMSRSIPSLAA